MKFGNITLALLAALLIPFFSSAQLDKSNISIGADFSGKRSMRGYGANAFQGSRNSYEIKSTNATAAFSASYFVFDNLSAGLYTTFSVEQDNYDDFRINTATSFAVGPMLRYYYKVKNFALFGQTHLQYGIEARNRKTGSGSNQVVAKESFNFQSIGIGPGVAYFLSDKASIETLLVYNRNLLIAKQIDTGNESYIEHLFTLNVGFYFYLNRPW